MSNAAVQHDRPSSRRKSWFHLPPAHWRDFGLGHSADFPERARASYLGKHLFIDMSPQEIETHGKVIREVFYTLLALNKKKKRGEFFSDRTLLTNEEADLSSEPDGAFALCNLGIRQASPGAA